MKPGRTFARSLIDASTTVKSLEHYIQLNAQACADITWWHLFAQSWNGTSLLPSAEPTQVTYSDASGSRGCGALCKTQWFYLQWPASWASTHLSPKDLAPIVIAIAVWGVGWAGQRIFWVERFARFHVRLWHAAILHVIPRVHVKSLGFACVCVK